MPPPRKVIAIYVPPRAARRRRHARADMSRPPTYRLRLERETEDGAGETIHTWGGIPHDPIAPVLQTLRTYLPWLARAATAREAFRRVLDLFH